MKIRVSMMMLAVLPLLLPAPPASAQSQGVLVLARYNSNGSLDATFDDDGKVLTAFGDDSVGATAVALDTMGRAVVAGQFYPNQPGGIRWALARYLPDGGIDSTFGPNGCILTNFDELRNEQLTDVAVDSAGRIVAAGWGHWTGCCRDDNRMALARYNGDGSLDVSFSEDGKRSLPFPPQFSADLYANAVAIDAAGRIVVAGEAAGSAVALARFSEGGQLDASFDGDGRVVTDHSFGIDVNAMVIAPDGKIVVAGGAVVGSTYQFALARYNPDGTLDPTFDGDGKVRTDFPSSSTEWAGGLVIDAAGKIVAVGSAEVGYGSFQFALARYNPDGKLDPTFDGDGMVLIDFASSPWEVAAGIAIDAQGKIVVLGQAQLGLADYRFALARFNPDGSLDSSFGEDGQVLTDFAGTFTGVFAQDIAIDADGKIVAVGSALLP